MAEKFMLVSLREDKAKKLAQVMSNPTCTRILDYLAGKDATESQIAKELNIPISTVHYNLQQLVDAKLVVIEEFHYSNKGREVNHYKLANKYIIIAPRDDPSFLANLKKYIPVTALVLGGAAVIKIMQLFGAASENAAPKLMAATGIADSAPAFAAPNAPVVPALPWWQSPVIDYFLAGAIFVLVVIVIVEAINYWRNKKR